MHEMLSCYYGFFFICWKKTVRQKEIDWNLYIFSFELFFFFFLRTNFKNIVRQISRTSDNSWLEYCERVILFFSLHCWMVRFFLILSMWGVITDRFFNWVSWGHGFRDGGHSFHFNIDWVSTNKHMPHRGSC